jgi:tRNA (guanine-N7-)-methyltransferase
MSQDKTHQDNTHSNHPTRHAPRRRLWGRAKGRPLSTYQKDLIAASLPALCFTPGDDISQATRGKGRKLVLEIGFGGAEHLLHMAAHSPQTDFIGAEPFLNGVAKALAGIERQGLQNIRLIHGDVSNAMDALPDHALDDIYILFPDPWPKPRHFKRRLISDNFVAEMHRILKPGGHLYFASDIPSYVDWALARILHHKDQEGSGFHWPANRSQDWLTPYENWPGTRYEAKALREGRTPHFFTFQKHITYR